jgi:hypothetical protein
VESSRCRAIFSGVARRSTPASGSDRKCYNNSIGRSWGTSVLRNWRSAHRELQTLTLRVPGPSPPCQRSIDPKTAPRLVDDRSIRTPSPRCRRSIDPEHRPRLQRSIRHPPHVVDDRSERSPTRSPGLAEDGRKAPIFRGEALCDRNDFASPARFALSLRRV